MVNNDKYCSYYQAQVERKMGWFVVAVLKSYDHVVLVRTLDVAHSIFEFYVPSSMESLFLTIIAALERDTLVTGLVKLPNRLQNSLEQV